MYFLLNMMSLLSLLEPFHKNKTYLRYSVFNNKCFYSSILNISIAVFFYIFLACFILHFIPHILCCPRVYFPQVVTILPLIPPLSLSLSHYHNLIHSFLLLLQPNTLIQYSSVQWAPKVYPFFPK